MRRIISSGVGWLCAFVALPVASATAPKALLVVLGDQHSAYEKAAQLVAPVDRLKGENPGVPLAVLINGDSFEYGNVVARRSAARIDLALFAALVKRAPVVLNLGNHEPNFQAPVETVAKLRAVGVVVISGNARDRNTGQPLAPASTVLPLVPAGTLFAGAHDHLRFVHRVDFDACVRFDGPVFTAEVDGTRLQKLAALANEGPETPFAQRSGEFSFAAGRLAGIDPAGSYRIATTDWGAKNSDRYFGPPAIAWREHPTLKLKAAVLAALAPAN